jgi:hypothetical protein
MILLKDLLYEMSSPNLLIPRKVEDRMEKYIQSKIKEYIKNNNVGDFDISGLGLTELPASLKDLKIGGSFDCSNNKLKFLTNAPTSVKTDFNCTYNLLNTLAGLTGAPSSVGGTFFCMRTNLKSLVGAPTSVKNFYCCYNKLTSLDGLIRDDGVRMSVVGNFHCYDNSVKFTEKQVRAVCDVKGDIYTY